MSYKPGKIAASLSDLYKSAYHKFYIDEIYLFITKNILFQFVSRPVAWFDRHIVDGAMNLIGNSTVTLSVAIKRMQSGQLQLYVWFFASGVILLTLVMLYLN